MVALKIDDIKQFTSKLFVGDVFDSFQVREVVITTFNTFTIDGHIRRGYYSEEELEEGKIGELSSWSMIKPICFSLIRGKKLPGSFQITLQLAPAAVERFLNQRQTGIMAEQVKGLYLNVRYENYGLSCITGTSLSVFTLEKVLETEWDEAVKQFLKAKEIVFE